MPIYELRTYTLHVGKMADAVNLFQQIAYPALEKSGHARKLVGYFQADTGTVNQLVHMWKFDDDADRRAHWANVFTVQELVEANNKFRMLIAKQHIKLLRPAPWGPHP